MSPTNARRSPDAATLAHPSGHAPADTPGGGNMSVLDNAVLEDSSLVDGAFVNDRHSSRPVAPARLASTRNSSAHPYDDPSNYLG